MAGGTYEDATRRSVGEVERFMRGSAKADRARLHEERRSAKTKAAGAHHVVVLEPYYSFYLLALSSPSTACHPWLSAHRAAPRLRPVHPPRLTSSHIERVEPGSS